MLGSQEWCIIIKSAGTDLLSQKPENNPDRVKTLSGLFSGFCESKYIPADLMIMHHSWEPNIA